MMLKMKLQYFGHLMRRVDSLEKTDAGRDWGQEEKGTTEDEMTGWHHRLNGPEFGWTLGVGDGQGGLACCDSWGRKESDTTEQLNWTEWLTMSAFPCAYWTFLPILWKDVYLKPLFAFYLVVFLLLNCMTSWFKSLIRYTLCIFFFPCKLSFPFLRVLLAEKFLFIVKSCLKKCSNTMGEEQD